MKMTQRGFNHERDESSNSLPYESVGIGFNQNDSQQVGRWRLEKDLLSGILVPGGIAITCGWNSQGFGINRGFELVEILIVCHGGAHNDTIVTVERKMPTLFERSKDS